MSRVGGDRVGGAPISIAVVDYGMGNRRSVQKALEHVGATVTVSGDAQRLREADALVVPGVGAFPAAMRSLCELGLVDVIRARATEGTPVLGICLGMQLLFERSVELEPTEGLGLIEGEVSPLQAGGLRVPHIGWNEVTFQRSSPLTSELPQSGAAFYHVHSLAARPRHPEDVVATTTYGETFATIVARQKVFGVQFHPEKSSGHGLRMLRSFVECCEDDWQPPALRVGGAGVSARA
jgi:imidazole glycerol-phosphate synthase subunit HisH